MPPLRTEVECTAVALGRAAMCTVAPLGMVGATPLVMAIDIEGMVMVMAIGHGPWALASQWPPRGRTTRITGTMIVSSGGPVGAG